ncbi:MAG: hypothetical protein Q8P19_01190 [bacterium]|nr:hypothetical protein [bacterium]
MRYGLVVGLIVFAAAVTSSWWRPSVGLPPLDTQTRYILYAIATVFLLVMALAWIFAERNTKQ